jgi:hypothetical protein
VAVGPASSWFMAQPSVRVRQGVTLTLLMAAVANVDAEPLPTPRPMRTFVGMESVTDENWVQLLVEEGR